MFSKSAKYGSNACTGRRSASNWPCTCTGASPRLPLKLSLPGSNRPAARRSDTDSGISLAATDFADDFSSSTRPLSCALTAFTSKATGLLPALSTNCMAPPARLTSSMAMAQVGALALTSGVVGGGARVAGLFSTSQRSNIQRLSASRSTSALGCITCNLLALKVCPVRSISAAST